MLPAIWVVSVACGLVQPSTSIRRRVRVWSREERTELSDSLEGAAADAAQAIVRATNQGKVLVQIDFDTSMGDPMYTTLKNSMEFTRGLVSRWAPSLDQLCVYFPDAGTAARAANDWKDAPPNVRFVAFPRDQPKDEDAAFLVVCPRASECEDTERLVDTMAREQQKPVALLNPELVDMGLTGFGLSGRKLRERLLNDIFPVYYLKTLQWGAVTKVYPAPYSIWQEDNDADGGYRFLKSTLRPPSFDELTDIYFEFNPAEDTQDSGLFGGFFKEFGKFASAFSKL